MYSWYT